MVTSADIDLTHQTQLRNLNLMGTIFNSEVNGIDELDLSNNTALEVFRISHHPIGS